MAALLLLIFLLVLPLSPPAQGASQTDILKQQLSQKLAAAEQASSKLNSLEKELAALEKAKDAAAAKLAGLEVEISDVRNNIEQAENDLADLRIQLEERLVDIYKSGGSWSMQYLEALVVEDDLSSVLDRFDMLAKLAGQDEQLFTEVESYLERSLADKTLLEQKKVEQQTQLDDLVKSQEQVSAKRAQYDAQYNSLKGQIASLNTQIKQAQAKEAAAAAARLKAVTDSAKKSSGAVGTTPTATKPTTPSNPSGAVTPPTSSAAIKAQADFIYRTFLVPRKSVLTGQMVMDIWIKYGISPAQSLAVLNAESGMGSLKWGGRLVSEGNNFGCMGYSASPAWANMYGAPISHGKIYVANRSWMMFYSVADGMEAWGRYMTYGRGRDCYRPLMRASNWTAFADIYYGKNVPGKAKYIERLTWANGMLKRTAQAAGYSW